MLNVKISKEYKDYLQTLAHQLSLKNGEQLTVSSLVRLAIEEKFPLPKIREMK